MNAYFQHFSTKNCSDPMLAENRLDAILSKCTEIWENRVGTDTAKLLGTGVEKSLIRISLLYHHL